MTIMGTRKKRTPQYNVAEAKARLSSIVREVLAGDEVIIAKDNKPVVKLVPFMAPGKARKPGSVKGQIWLAPDFDATPADFQDYT